MRRALIALAPAAIGLAGFVALLAIVASIDAAITGELGL